MKPLPCLAVHLLGKLYRTRQMASAKIVSLEMKLIFQYSWQSPMYEKVSVLLTSGSLLSITTVFKTCVKTLEADVTNICKKSFLT